MSILFAKRRLFVFESLCRPDVKVGLWSIPERNNSCARAHQEIFYLNLESEILHWQISDAANILELPQKRRRPPVGFPQCSHKLAQYVTLTTAGDSLSSISNGMAVKAQVARLTRECEAYIAAISHDRACTLWEYGNTDGSCMDSGSIPPYLDSEPGILLGEALCTGAKEKQPAQFHVDLELDLIQIYTRQRDTSRAEKAAVSVLAELQAGHRQAPWRAFDTLTNKWIGDTPPLVQWNTMHTLMATFIFVQNFNVAEEVIDLLAEGSIFDTIRSTYQENSASVSTLQKKQMAHLRMSRPLVKIRVAKYKEAALSIANSIEFFPLDFLMGFILQYLARKLEASGELSPSELIRLQSVSDGIDKRYNERMKGSRNAFNLHGHVFAPPRGKQPNLGPYNSTWRPNRVSDWQPRRLNRIPTPAEFIRFVKRREPFVISMQDEDPTSTTEAPHCPRLLRELKWSNACKWDADYMCKHAGTEEVSLSSVGPDQDEALSAVCGSPTNGRTSYDFCEYSRKVFDAGEIDGDVTHGVGYFDASSAASSTLIDTAVIGFPLNVLRHDIPTPVFLDRQTDFYQSRRRNGYVDPSNPEIIDISLVTVLFWMGAASSKNPGQSGLHFDVLENFHVMLRGKKV